MANMDNMDEKLHALNMLFAVFMPKEGNSYGYPNNGNPFGKKADYVGLMAISTQDENGRFVNPDGVRFNIRFYHFETDPGEEYYQREVLIPDNIEFYWDKNEFMNVAQA